MLSKCVGAGGLQRSSLYLAVHSFFLDSKTLQKERREADRETETFKQGLVHGNLKQELETDWPVSFQFCFKFPGNQRRQETSLSEKCCNDFSEAEHVKTKKNSPKKALSHNARADWQYQLGA